MSKVISLVSLAVMMVCRMDASPVTEHLAWEHCSKECGSGTRQEADSGRRLPCNSFSCDPNPRCECSSTDLMFLIDHGRVANWRQKQFLQDVIHDLYYQGSDHVKDSRVAMVNLANEVTNNFDFENGYSLRDIETLDQHMWNLDVGAGERSVGAGFQIAEAIFANQSGDNEKMAVFLTDGIPSRDEEETILQTELLRSSGVSLFALGIVGNGDEPLLRRIVSQPTHEFYAMARNYRFIKVTVDKVLTAICCNFESSASPSSDTSAAPTTAQNAPVTTATANNCSKLEEIMKLVGVACKGCMVLMGILPIFVILILAGTLTLLQKKSNTRSQRDETTNLVQGGEYMK